MDRQTPNHDRDTHLHRFVVKSEDKLLELKRLDAVFRMLPVDPVTFTDTKPLIIAEPCICRANVCWEGWREERRVLDTCEDLKVGKGGKNEDEHYGLNRREYSMC